jgi:ATP-binding cassette subfamily B protein
MQVVRTFDDGTSSFKRYCEALTEATATMKAWTERTQMGAFIARILFAALPTLAIIVPVGIWMVNNNWLDLPTLLLFIFLAPTVAESIVPMVWLSHLINMASAGAKRIGRLLAEPVLPEPAAAQLSSGAEVEFDNVSFNYANREQPALHNISLTMPAGTVTALVGPSGAGKSTIAQLIPRFWDVGQGAVRVGGVDVRQMSSDDLMRQVSFVFQTPFLLHDTLRENIRLGKPTATDDEVEAAARAAQAHDFIINELPEGDTRAGERGTRLSGGQRQRITIARAILQDSPIVVLDEATAFADPENEAKIHAAIANLTAGKTLIVVAHRLSTIRDAHQIAVLDKGRLVKLGTHDELVAASGVYAGLWAKFEEAQGWGLRRSNGQPPRISAQQPVHQSAMATAQETQET